MYSYNGTTDNGLAHIINIICNVNIHIDRLYAKENRNTIWFSYQTALVCGWYPYW